MLDVSTTQTTSDERVIAYEADDFSSLLIETVVALREKITRNIEDLINTGSEDPAEISGIIETQVFEYFMARFFEFFLVAKGISASIHYNSTEGYTLHTMGKICGVEFYTDQSSYQEKVGEYEKIELEGSPEDRLLTYIPAALLRDIVFPLFNKLLVDFKAAKMPLDNWIRVNIRNLKMQGIFVGQEIQLNASSDSKKLSHRVLSKYNAVNALFLKKKQKLKKK